MKKKIAFIFLGIVIFLSGLLFGYMLGHKTTFQDSGSSSGIIHKVHKKSYTDEYDYDSKYSRRGYYVEEVGYELPNIIIAMGTQNTGGYYINVVDIKIDKDKNVTIIVEETEPAKDSVVTMAITYPTARLELYGNPNNITVKNTKGEMFSKIEN